MVLQVPAHAAGDKPNKDTFDYTLTPLNGYAITGGVTDYVESPHRYWRLSNRDGLPAIDNLLFPHHRTDHAA